MKISDLVTALQPLVGWHIYVNSHKINDTMPCYAVRRLERYERKSKHNVILASGKEDLGFPSGVSLLAKDIVRVDWTRDRAWIESREHHLGYFQRIRPIEETGPETDTWESLERGYIDYPEPSQTYGTDD